MEAAMKRNNESGQALVFTAVAMVVLIGFAGLGIDMGVLRYQKRLQQTAADAGAIAGASNLDSATLGVSAGAVAAAAGNSFSAGTTGSQVCPTSVPACTACPAGTIGSAVGSVDVTVNNPPCFGPHLGDKNYVEVYVSEVQPTYFMKAVGVPSETITARAVATNVSGGGPNSGCLFTLGAPSSSIEGVNINGNATLNAPTCGINDNGNFNTKGNALDVSSATFGISGDWDKSGPGGTVTCGPTQPNCPATGVPAATVPPFLAQLTPPCNPCIAPGTNPTPVTQNGVTTYSPGTYGNLSIGPATVNFSPGVYIMAGNNGLSIGANATVTGTGVTFYFTNGGTLNMVGTPTVNLTAPGSSGQYPGILFYQDPSDTSGPSMGGNSGNTFDGVAYFPTANVTFFGHNTSVDAAMVVADAITLSGTPTVNLQGASALPAGVTFLTHAVLVE
jgi:Flp pilus assembly protein TadG